MADAWGPAVKESRPASPVDPVRRSGVEAPGPKLTAPLNPLAPAPTSVTSKPPPLHVGAPAIGSLTHAAEEVAKSVGSGVGAPGLPASVSVAPAGDGSPSSLRVALLAMGLLAAAVLVVVGLFRLSDREQVTNVEAEATRLGLPTLVASTADTAEPSVRTADEARAALAELERAGALLFFADPSSAEGIDTAELAVEIHRRLRDREGLRVALIVPAPPGPAASASADAVRDVLRGRGVTSDLLVLVDPIDESSRAGLWRRTRFDVPEASAAVLIEDGLQAMRVSPPTAGMALTRSHVAPLVREALARHPVVVSPGSGEAPVDDDPAAGEGDTVPERTKPPR